MLECANLKLQCIIDIPSAELNYERSTKYQIETIAVLWTGNLKLQPEMIIIY